MIAHRGLSGIEMENTCSAFVAAGNRSFFGIETDVHVTKDGQFIIIHDDTTQRVALDNLTVEESSYETLRSLRLCDKDGKRGRKDLALPSLCEYIQICEKYEKVSVLELKNHMQPQDIDRIIDVIREEGWLDQTIFISFDLPNMVYVEEKPPDRYRLDLDAHFSLITEERLKTLHGAGKEVNVWTVDRLEDARRLSDWGVDYITSNIIE